MQARKKAYITGTRKYPVAELMPGEEYEFQAEDKKAAYKVAQAFYQYAYSKKNGRKFSMRQKEGNNYSITRIN